ncbi:MAG: glutaredoxin family protein [Candidatus Binatia bacterium]
MTWHLTLYTRQDCGLCEEMKEVICEVGAEVPLEVEEVDVEGEIDLRERFSGEVPVLFIEGRKAFKYRVTARELRKRLKH